jgi:hypothetical protein
MLSQPHFQQFTTNQAISWGSSSILQSKKWGKIPLPAACTAIFYERLKAVTTVTTVTTKRLKPLPELSNSIVTAYFLPRFLLHQCHKLLQTVTASVTLMLHLILLIIKKIISFVTANP